MMKPIFLSLLISLTIVSCKEELRTFSADELKLLPQPNALELQKGAFEIIKGQKIKAGLPEQQSAVNALKDFVLDRTGLELALDSNNTGTISFEKKAALGPEAYELVVSPENIRIYANDDSGYFYAVQTLKQLVLNDTNENTTSSKFLVPALTIKDHPRFKWRAFLLDDSRYFHGEAFVKQMLDQMALLKMNTLHWHLVDDAGWRIEIKKYPKLTEIGAFRSDSEIGTWKSGKTSGEPHGGFYTQEQIKNIVSYAQKLNINIVPEFEMPGHASAAIASYPWLGTAGKAIEVPVQFGRLYDNYDVTKPEVITFIKDVLTEMFELFPSEVIHIGGDEVGYDVWENSASVQKYMKEHNISTPADLQIHFTNTISQFIEKNGRRMMGWNEILGKNIHADFEEKQDDKEAETELAKNTIVHFWKGDLDLLTEAAKNGYDIVNSLHSSTYLDYSYKSIPLEKAYSFDPIPEGLDEKYHQNIYGLGCQMWSEWTPTNADMERQTFPRIAAYAEVGWTLPENKNFERFKNALKPLEKHWDTLGINYYKDYDLKETAPKEN